MNRNSGRGATPGIDLQSPDGRSERLSTFRHNPLRNPLLLFGTLTAQLIHIAAMYTPWISDVLQIQPISPQHWLELLGFALSVLVAMELHKAIRQRLGTC